MVKGLYTAYTGMVNEQRRMDVMTNNLANSNTTGYKKEALVAQSFNEKLAIKIKDTSAPGHMPEQIGQITFGVKPGETYTNWDEGAIQVTENPYDIAIGGEGFFAVEFTNKNGQSSVMYTRDGGLTVDRDGYLRTTDGDYILNQEGALTGQTGEDFRVKVDPNKQIAIGSNGDITQGDNEVVSTIGLVTPTNFDYINKHGENLYTLIDGGQIQAATGTIRQGCLEASNVNVVDEMVNMIEIARAYEAGQKMIQTEDSTLEKTVNAVGKV